MSREDRERGVTVTGVDVPIGDLLVLMIKVGIAAVPAVIVIALTYFAAMMLLGGASARFLHKASNAGEIGAGAAQTVTTERRLQEGSIGCSSRASAVAMHSVAAYRQRAADCLSLTAVRVEITQDIDAQGIVQVRMPDGTLVWVNRSAVGY
jgi:hypothetical protein